MPYSSPISLFSGPPKRDTEPSAFVVSMVLHGCVFGMMFVGMHHVTVVQREANRRYMVRLLNVRETEASSRWYPQQPKIVRLPKPVAHRAISAAAKIESPKLSLARMSRNFETDKPALQTMIQPEVPPDQRILPQIPIPQAMVWNAGKVSPQKIVPPTPKITGAIPVTPSLAKPNQELALAEIPLTSMPFVTKAPLPNPGTTSPVKVNGPSPAKQLPQTASKDTGEPTAARVISMSQQRLDVGTAALPVVNEIAAANAPGSPSPGEADSWTLNGTEKVDSGPKGQGTAHGTGKSGDDSDGVVANGSDDASGDGVSIDTGEGESPVIGGDPPPVTHIVAPRGGQYGMIVVGASPEEDYPQTAHLWTGRLVYSVYLQTETNQNWILQYSLIPKPGDDPDPSHPDAPWPYDMMRPNLSYNDVVLVHGFVNTDGRFEKLSVAYPPEFSKTGLLLSALKKWEFRPAMNQGQPTTVEVLLIIPGSAD